MRCPGLGKLSQGGTAPPPLSALPRCAARRPQLLGKTDARFVEAAWRFLREKLDIKPALTPAQFLSEVRPGGTGAGFAVPLSQLFNSVSCC